MCVIIAKPKGVEVPSKKVIKMGHKKNDDGAGIAFTNHENDVIIKKDFNNFDNYWNFIDDTITKNLSAVFHMRIRTSGKSDKGGRHPFPISEEKSVLREDSIVADEAVAHNGTFSDFSFSDSDLNDSQIMTASILFPNRDKIVNNAFRFLLNNYVDDNNSRLTILTEEGLLMFGDWKEKNGLLFSNTLSVPFKKVNKVKDIGGGIIKDKSSLDEFETSTKTIYSNIKSSTNKKRNTYYNRKLVDPGEVMFANFERLYSMRDRLPPQVFKEPSTYKNLCDKCGIRDYSYNMYAAWDSEEKDNNGNLIEYYILCPECLQGEPIQPF